MIANQNKDIISTYCKGIKFIELTKNTCYFSYPNSKFQKLYDWVKSEGYNPFALMSW
jgi:hypothetical protein